MNDPAVVEQRPADSDDQISTDALERRYKLPALVLLITLVAGLAAIGFIANDRTSKIFVSQGAGEAKSYYPLQGIDKFERPNSKKLGQSDSGQNWTASSGIWGVENGAATLISPLKGKRNLVLLRTGASGGTLSVQFDALPIGAGLAFRCRNMMNCWFVESVANLGTWKVSKVVKGVKVDVGNLGLVPVKPGTTISVSMTHETITIFVDGVKARRIKDSDLGLNSGVGLSFEAGKDAEKARWGSIFLNPTPPIGIAQLEGASFLDDFARPDTDGTLGSPWGEYLGVFGVSGYYAVLEKQAQSDFSVATIDTTRSDGIVQSSLASSDAGAGLAFRCRNALNCWYVVALPGSRFWEIYKVVGGFKEKVDAFPSENFGAGSTVAVRLKGKRIEIYVDGQLSKTINDLQFSKETRAGLASQLVNYKLQARWRQFLAAPNSAFSPRDMSEKLSTSRP